MPKTGVDNLPMNNEFKINKYLRVFNPVFISWILILLLPLILILRDAFLISYIELVSRLVFPTMYECSTLGGIGIFAGFISYFLALVMFVFYFMALKSKTQNKYITVSILGVFSTIVWFSWGALLFILCGIRAH